MKHFPDHCYDRIPLMTKPDKYITRKLETDTLINTKIPNKILKNKSECYRIRITHQKQEYLVCIKHSENLK